MGCSGWPDSGPAIARKAVGAPPVGANDACAVLAGYSGAQGRIQGGGVVSVLLELLYLCTRTDSGCKSLICNDVAASCRPS